MKIKISDKIKAANRNIELKTLISGFSALFAFTRE